MNRKILALSFVMILLLSTGVYALGVTSPVPKGMQLLRGESSAFEFEIQAVTSSEDLICTYSIAEIPELQVSFDENEITVPAGQIKKVYGQIAVPLEAPFTGYSGEIIVSCGAKDDSGSGSQVKTTIGGNRLMIEVVEKRESDKKSAEIPEEAPDMMFLLILLIIIIIIGAYYKLKHKKPKKTRKKK